VIDLQGLFKSAILTAIVPGKRKVGPSGGREGSRLALSETAIPVDYDEHAVDRYLRVAKALGAPVNGWKGEIPVSREDIRFADEQVKSLGLKGHRIVAINPMARWKTKLWDEDKFAVLADRLTWEIGTEVLLTGSGTDRSALERIRSLSSTKPVNLAGRTSLKQLACVYKKCALLISTDTGPMHMAAASGCPVVALFGPTAPWRTGPYGPEHRVIRETMHCSPCFKKSCDAMLCMKSITPGMVLDSVREVLENRIGNPCSNG
jgi:3-deoxy-D-manno-octulosonic-acid transferase/heptosyltransferase-1